MSFIAYQIDYKVLGTGKTLGLTKKRVIFKFGFANSKALAEGQTGAACRGSEHEVVLVMSLASGKRHVLLDGREVHFSQGEKMSRTFDFPFTVRIPNVGHVQARLTSDYQGGANPYNFFINGTSYFHFSKIYELGTPAMRVGQMHHPHQQRSYTNHSELEAPPEERRLIAQAKLESMRELREKQEREAAAETKQMNRDEGNLINFDDDVAAPAPPPEVPQQGGMMYQASSLTLDPALQQSQSYGYTQDAPAPSGAAYQNYSINTSQTTNAPTQQQYGYAPAPSSTTQYSQQSTQYSQQTGAPASSMLTQYSQPPAPYAAAPAPYAAAPAPYAQAPPPMTASFSSASAQQQPSAYGYPQQSAPAPTYEETQTSFGTPAPAPTQQQFATPQSQASYGSAPAFAQPPRSASGASAPPPPAGSGNYGAYPNTGSAW
jgi:hypothetical protein